MLKLQKDGSLGDIRDVRAFVAASLRTTNLYLQPEEREDIISEGVVILIGMAKRFDLRRDGYDHDGRFSGFAAKYLPGALIRAWRSSLPHHRFGQAADGKRVWHQEEPAVSLYATEDGSALDVRSPHDGLSRDTHLVGDPAAVRRDDGHIDFNGTLDMQALLADSPTVDAALRTMPPGRRLGARLALEHIAVGRSEPEIAGSMMMTTGQVRQIRSDLCAAILQVERAA